MTPEQEKRLRDASAGGWTFDGRAQPYVGDLRALLDEVDRYREHFGDLPCPNCQDTNPHHCATCLAQPR